MSRRALASLLGLSLLLAVAVGLRLSVRGFDGVDWRAIIEIRAAHAVTGAIVGAALAVAGVLLQSMLRNPLASPDLLGLATGSGLAVMLALYVGSLAGASFPTFAATRGAAIVGALAALALVYALSQRRGLLDPVTLVLVGFVLSVLFGSGIELLRHFMQNQETQAMRLIGGGLRGEASTTEIAVVGAITLAGVLGAFALGRAMDAMALGDDEAHSVGVPVARVRLFLFILAGVLTAASVVLAGAIGFVGLVAPHLVRLIAGPAHRPLILGSALTGAAMVVLADSAVSAIATDAGRIPIGVLTSLIGGPVFVMMLRRETRVPSQ